MKFAEVSYHGPMRSANRHGEEGAYYKFRNPMGGEPQPEPVYNLNDALSFAKQDVFEVDWTVQGEVARRVGRQVQNAQDSMRELSYRQKQKLTTALGLDVQGNSPEEELDEALEPAVEKMLKQIETQRR